MDRARRRQRDDGGGGAHARDGARRQSTAGDARRLRGGRAAACLPPRGEAPRRPGHGSAAGGRAVRARVAGCPARLRHRAHPQGPARGARCGVDRSAHRGDGGIDCIATDRARFRGRAPLRARGRRRLHRPELPGDGAARRGGRSRGDLEAVRHSLSREVRLLLRRRAGGDREPAGTRRAGGW